MRARLPRVLAGPVLVVALGLAAPVAAHAQTPPVPTPTPTATASPSPTATPSPTVTPTPTPTPTYAKQTKETRRVYRDYKRDGVIEACDHTRKDLRRTLKTIRPQFEEEFPDFRDAVRAAIKQHNRRKCTQPEPTPTATPAPTTPSTPAPTTPSTPAPAPSNPAPAPAAPAPLPAPSRTPKAPRSTPTPQATVPPAPTPTPSPTPNAAQQEAQAVVTRPGKQGSLLVPAILLVLVLLGAAAAGGSALLGTHSARFAPMGQAWREAAWRAGGTWGNFTDWMRLGR